MRWSYRFGVRPGLDLLVAVFVLCVLFMALEPRAEAGVGDGEDVAFASGVDIAAAVAQKNELRIVHPAKGAHISGKIRIKLKLGQKIKRVFVFIDNRYFASGPPYPIFWNSAKVSNGPHRITVAAATTALSPDAMFLASRSQDTTNLFVHNQPKVSPMLSASSTTDPSSWPAGVPTPQAIPTLTPPVNPITVAPGTSGVVGNATQNMTTGVISGTDDTAAFQTLINSHDIIVQAGNYRIAGSFGLAIPSDRVIQCQPGATFYGSNDSAPVMMNMGWFGGSPTNISISGCTFAGTNVPTGVNNYGAYDAGVLQLMAIAGNGNGGASHVNIQNNTFENGQQDGITTYDNCGTANFTSSSCNGMTPGVDGEGPNHIWIAGNTFTHFQGGPGVHINGGQYIYVANNTLTDANLNQEENPGTLEVIKGLYIYHNMLLTSSFGQIGQEFMSCVGNQTIASNGSGCWAVQNTLSGCSTSGNCMQLAIGSPDVQVSGSTTGNYFGNSVQDGAVMTGSGTNQLTVPYCNGGTCSKTNWLLAPPAP